MKRIFLIGYMGSGKTSIGKHLASRMGLSFVDLDVYIEQRYHKTVRELFAERGEESFRRIEQKMLHEVAGFEDTLISTGGGSPCFFDNIAFMKKTGETVYLKVSVDTLAKRLDAGKRTRPVLQNKSGEALRLFIDENLQKREPYYTQASIIFDTEKMTTESDLQAITDALEHILKKL